MSEIRFPNDIALVLQGGGVRGAFTAGVLDVLMEHDIVFDYVIGTSAGGLNAVNYLAHDIGRSKYVTTKLMSDSRFVSMRNYLKTGNAFNFDYLMHVVPKTKLPFSQERFENSTARFFVAATSVETGEPAYFQKGVCAEFDNALAATASLPLFAKPVSVEGKLYMDGGPVAAIPFRKPLHDGMKRLVVVLTRKRGYRKKPVGATTRFSLKTLYKKYTNFYAALKKQNDTYNQGVEEVEGLEQTGVAFIIAPDVPPDVGLFEKKEAKLLALYEQGRQVMERELPRLLDFVGADHE